MSQTLPESLTLASFLARHFEKLRKEDLGGQAAESMTPGERFAVKFGGRLAAWVSMPQPAARATVKNPAAFLAWVKKTLPTEVETVEIVRPGTQKNLLEMAVKDGGWLDEDSGKRIPIPGVEVGGGKPSARVELDDDAEEIIGAAWRSGEIDLGGMLAIAAGPPAGADVPAAAPDAAPAAGGGPGE